MSNKSEYDYYVEISKGETKILPCTIYKKEEKLPTFEDLIKEDHSTVDYAMTYYKKIDRACIEVGITLEQGMKFLDALYKNDHDIK